MENIKDIKLELFNNIIDQKYMNDLLKNLIQSSINNRDKIYYSNKLNGGKCNNCGIPFEKVKKNTPFAKYEIYEPVCKCFLNYQENIRIKHLQNKILIMSGVPEKFIDKDFKTLDWKNIHADTKESFMKVKKYIDEKIYDKTGCLLYGSVGPGKTLMSILIYKHLLFNENKKCKFVKMSKLIKTLISSNFEFSAELIEYDVILFDDLDKLEEIKDKIWLRQEIFTIFDMIYNNNKILLATTNVMEVKELGKYYDVAVLSRILGNCQQIKITGYDYRLIEQKNN